MESVSVGNHLPSKQAEKEQHRWFALRHVPIHISYVKTKRRIVYASVNDSL